MQGTMPGAHRRGSPRTAWMDNIKTWTGLPLWKSQSERQSTEIMEKVRPQCGQPSDRGWLKNRTVQKPNVKVPNNKTEQIKNEN